jgi:hypothetical protein
MVVTFIIMVMIFFYVIAIFIFLVYYLAVAGRDPDFLVHYPFIHGHNLHLPNDDYHIPGPLFFYCWL